MKITGILSLLLLTAQLAFAGFGEINGRVLDADGQPVYSAHVLLKSGDQAINQAFTDFEGYYVIKPISSGTYNMSISLIGFQTQVIENISVSDGQIRVVDFTLSNTILDGPTITAYKDLVEPGYPIKIAIIGYKELEVMPIAPLDAPALTSGAFQADYGDPIQFRGARPDATLYIIDGIKIIGEPVAVRNSIDDIVVYSGGIPAKYGDATGGIVVITTKSYKKLR